MPQFSEQTQSSASLSNNISEQILQFYDHFSYKKNSTFLPIHKGKKVLFLSSAILQNIDILACECFVHTTYCTEFSTHSCRYRCDPLPDFCCHGLPLHVSGSNAHAYCASQSRFCRASAILSSMSLAPGTPLAISAA